MKGRGVSHEANGHGRNKAHHSSVTGTSVDKIRCILHYLIGLRSTSHHNSAEGRCPSRMRNNASPHSKVSFNRRRPRRRLRKCRRPIVREHNINTNGRGQVVQSKLDELHKMSQWDYDSVVNEDWTEDSSCQIVDLPVVELLSMNGKESSEPESLNLEFKFDGGPGDGLDDSDSILPEISMRTSRVTPTTSIHRRLSMFVPHVLEPIEEVVESSSICGPRRRV